MLTLVIALTTSPVTVISYKMEIRKFNFELYKNRTLGRFFRAKKSDLFLYMFYNSNKHCILQLKCYANIVLKSLFFSLQLFVSYCI